MEELGRFRFCDIDEVGIYDAGDGEVELVWFDQQDPDWPVRLPLEMLRPLAAKLTEITDRIDGGEPTQDQPDDRCRVFWGSHGCDRPRGHGGPHLCLSCRSEDEEGWVGAPPYYGPDTHFYGEDAEAM